MWLSTEEASLAGQRLAFNGSHGGASTMTWKEAKVTLMDWRLYIHYIVSNGLFLFVHSQMITSSPDLFCSLGFLLFTIPIHTLDRGRSRLLLPSGTTDDDPPMGRFLRHHRSRRLHLRPLQRVRFALGRLHGSRSRRLPRLWDPSTG
jgi:hypothetical protein